VLALVRHSEGGDVVPGGLLAVGVDERPAEEGRALVVGVHGRLEHPEGRLVLQVVGDDGGTAGVALGDGTSGGGEAVDARLVVVGEGQDQAQTALVGEIEDGVELGPLLVADVAHEVKLDEDPQRVEAGQ
jgi:hypothetical protein